MNGDPRYHEAIERFSITLERVQDLQLAEPMAFSLATVDAGGSPSVRIVLLRGFDERGFVYFTNALSRKGRDVAANPQAALGFYWDALKEQIRIEGRVESISAAESDLYWSRRPRTRQLASYASRQSEVLAGREVYEQEVERLSQAFAGQDVPRPPHWLGYRVVPNRFEFWLGDDARMHIRTVFQQTDAGWQTHLLYP